LAALSISFLIGWGFIAGLGYPDRLLHRPILITAKIVIDSVKPRQPPSRVLPAYSLRHLPVSPPKIVAPPVPEIPVVTANNKLALSPPPPKDDHTPLDRGKPALPAPLPGDYLSLLLAHLNAYKRYPYGARLHHEQGTVRLEFTMDRAGNVLSYRVVGSSGFPDLDNEAREMIQNAQPLPPVPPSYPGTTLDLVLPLVFSLNR
jgi:protein TonB